MSDPLFNHIYSDENLRWYSFKIERTFSIVKEWINFYTEIISWINENIDGALKHARWGINPEHAIFYFRYERDYLRFLLRYS